MYISLGIKLLLKYSVEEDIWTALDFPPLPGRERIIYPTGVATQALGLWEGLIFTSRVDQRYMMFTNGIYEKVTVWELVDQKWVEYVVMSENFDCLMESIALESSHNMVAIVVPCFPVMDTYWYTIGILTNTERSP